MQHTVIFTSQHFSGLAIAVSQLCEPVCMYLESNFIMTFDLDVWHDGSPSLFLGHVQRSGSQEETHSCLIENNAC